MGSVVVTSRRVFSNSLIVCVSLKYLNMAPAATPAAMLPAVKSLDFLFWTAGEACCCCAPLLILSLYISEIMLDFFGFL